MEAKATELLAAFKNPNVSVESRVAHLTTIKSDIKQKNVPEVAIPTLFETLRLALSSQHYSVFAAGFSTFNHFVKRLSIQNQQQLIASQAQNLYPTLVDRLGDHKERVRNQAAQMFTELWPAASSEVEYHVLENALVGKNPRAKETSMLWLSNVSSLACRLLCWEPLTLVTADDQNPRLVVPRVCAFSGCMPGGSRQCRPRHGENSGH